jgi:hypothetical protein
VRELWKLGDTRVDRFVWLCQTLVLANLRAAIFHISILFFVLLKLFPKERIQHLHQIHPYNFLECNYLQGLINIYILSELRGRIGTSSHSSAVVETVGSTGRESFTRDGSGCFIM